SEFPCKIKVDENKIQEGIHLSILNDIKVLLDIQDKNIIFEENGVYIKNYKGYMSKFVSAKLTYIPTHCEKCGVKNDHYTIYKNGTKTSHIKLPMYGRSEEHTSELQSRFDLVCRLLLEKKKDCLTTSVNSVAMS